MLKRLFKFPTQLFKNIAPRQGTREHHIIPREKHPISRKNISPSALKVMRHLHEANFDAYLVGGGVRDLLLGGNPKDFDIATDATPEQVKRLFRSARIIGRRFRIVHVRFGREVIEVTTFRAHHESAQNNHEAASSDIGMLTRDNVYGDIQSDAARRDFTVNALYYSTNGFSIHDYAGGMQDIDKRIVRMIGNPETRYKEDPVRMLRAVRFAAKLSFTIEPTTAKPIKPLSELLQHVPPARLFEEVLKLFMGGHAAPTLRLLHEYRLLEHLFPATAAALDSGDPYAKKLIELAMHNTDKRIRNHKRVTPAFIYAALLWPALRQEKQRLIEKNISPLPAIQQAGQQIVNQQLLHTSIPKRFLIPMREIWDLQLRLTRRYGKSAERLSQHPRFRAAYDFILLREEAGEDLNGLGQWWTQYQNVSPEERQHMVAQLGSQRQKRPRRRRRKQQVPTAP